MRDWLSERAQATPDKTALVCAGTKLTFADLARKSGEYRRVLADKDVHIKQGQNIALLGGNTCETVAMIFALIQIGAVIVPLNTRLTPEEIDYQVSGTNCTVLLYEQSLKTLAEKLTPSTYQIAPYPASTLSEHVEDYPPEMLDLDEPFAIIHTSGTSGKPKGTVLSYGNVFHSAMASAYRIGHNPNDKWLCCLPLYHIGGLSIIIRACLYGITVDLHQKFDATEINHALTHHEITLISLVPTMLYRLLEVRAEPWSSKLRLVLLGGSATSPDLMEKCFDLQIPVATTYGLSEAASQVATTLPGDAIRKPGSVGKPLLFTSVRIIDENGGILAAGQLGEIAVKGQTVMKGYFNNPEASTRTLRDGWMYTGDMGYVDADGDLWVVQRRSDLIISGGENVYPVEVENILKQHPAVKIACVVGIDNPEWGQQVAAAIVLHPEQPVTITELNVFCRQHLAGYKQPRHIRVVAELPLTASGKIHRLSVQELLKENM
jgi:o-succinylbenzoate---CoA ligase